MPHPERGGDVVEVRHGAHIDPGLRHRHHHVGAAEAELVEQHDARLRLRDQLADQILAGDAEVDRALRELRGDLGRGQVGDLDIVELGDRAAIVARAARLHQCQSGAREECLGVLLQAAFGRHRDDKRAHEAPPISASRSTQTENPTAGIGAAAPSRVSRPS